MSLYRLPLIINTALVLLLCFSHIAGSGILILGILLLYLILITVCCTKNFTLPMLLFFLPWSQLLRTSPDNFSFYTFGLVIICLVSIIKKKFSFKGYHIAAGIVISFITLLSKLLDGSWISFDYIAFIMLIVLFPVVKEESKAEKYGFYQIVVFFSVGVITAALCAYRFAHAPHISKYITVHSYLTITRMCGFYGDPNFYVAQVTAAMGGCLYCMLHSLKRQGLIVLSVLLAVLTYCGFMSGSKSFIIVAIVSVFVWVFEIMRMHGKTGRKIILIIFAFAMVLYITFSALFGGWIDIVMTRLSFAKNLSDFTTGRTEIWQAYIREIFTDIKVFMIGKGLTNDILIMEKATHNTIIQAIFQFGILGTVVLVAWIIGFFKEKGLKRIYTRKDASLFVLLIATLLPWMAIDILLFDEFFLFQWYILSAMRQNDDIYAENNANTANESVQCPGQRRTTIKIRWN